MDEQRNTAWLKKLYVSVLFFCMATIAVSQSSINVVFQQYKSAKTVAEKNNVMDAYFETLRGNNLEPTLRDLAKMYDYFKNEGDISGIGTGRIGLFLAVLYEKSGEYKNSLLYALPALHNFEQINDTSHTIDAFLEIGVAFTSSENIPQGLYYYNQCKLIIEAYHDKSNYPLVLNNIATCYNEINQADSALPIINTALSLVEKIKDSAYLGLIYTTMGETHLAKGDDALARTYLNKSLHYAKSISYDIIATIYCGLAKSYFNTGEYNLSLQSAYNAVWYAEPNYKKELMLAYECIYKAFEKANVDMRDSVNKYFRLAATIKDSLFTVQKTISQQQIYLQEQLRSEEMQIAKLKEAAERKQMITYILIGIGIISFIGLFLLLSRSFLTNTKVIRGLGIMALLIVFEFFNLLLHPFLEKVTGHSTLLMLLALACIAALLAPLHHKTENWAINKLIEKNKRIRITKAKKTIELLDKPNGDDSSKT